MISVKKTFCALAIASSALYLGGCNTMQSAANTAGGWVGMDSTSRVQLTGAEEVPPVSTSAAGEGSFHITKDGTVTGSVTTTGIESTAAHIHRGAKGQNGPVIVPLTKNGNTFTTPAGAKLSEADLKAYHDGMLYVNVHSAAHKGGEIRAQLQP
jgi:hypothetical protein